MLRYSENTPKLMVFWLVAPVRGLFHVYNLHPNCFYHNFSDRSIGASCDGHLSCEQIILSNDWISQI